MEPGTGNSFLKKAGFMAGRLCVLKKKSSQTPQNHMPLVRSLANDWGSGCYRHGASKGAFASGPHSNFQRGGQRPRYRPFGDGLGFIHS